MNILQTLSMNVKGVQFCRVCANKNSFLDEEARNTYADNLWLPLLAKGKKITIEEAQKLWDEESAEEKKKIRDAMLKPVNWNNAVERGEIAKELLLETGFDPKNVHVH